MNYLQTLTQSYNWQYTYEYNGPAVLVQNGGYIYIPFNVPRGCLKYFIGRAEAMINGTTCAMDVVLPPYTKVCSPVVYGQVTRADGTTPIRGFDATLKNPGLSTYGRDCKDGIDFSFCTSNTFPYVLEIKNMFPNHINSSGVTTYDGVLITKHMSGNSPITDPLKILAADVSIADNNPPNVIGNDDRAAIKRAALHGDYSLFDVPSWYIFPENFPISINNPRSSVGPSATVAVNVPGAYIFHGVRSGDIDLSFMCTGLRPNGSNNSASQLKTQQAQRNGQRMVLPFHTNARFDLIAAQIGLRFDPALYEFKEVIYHNELVHADHFAFEKAAEGELRFGWFDEGGMGLLPAQGHIFDLVFELKSNQMPASGNICWSSEQVMPCLAYDKEGTEYPFHLTHAVASVEDRDAPQLGMVLTPNPASDNVQLFLHATRPGVAHLRLIDVQGRTVREIKTDLAEGENALSVALHDLPSGCYVFTAQMEGQTLSRKLVKVGTD